jgi:hypothetical protein
LIAEKKGVSTDDVKALVEAHGGASFTGTKAEANKFHDDKSLYTGVHAQGGPTNVDSINPVASFGQQLNLEEEKKEPAAAKTKTATVATS